MFLLIYFFAYLYILKLFELRFLYYHVFCVFESKLLNSHIEENLTTLKNKSKFIVTRVG